MPASALLRCLRRLVLFGAALGLAAHADEAAKPASLAASVGVGVGAQYDTTHVYVPAAEHEAFVSSFVATFGGKPSKRLVFTVTPTPSSTQGQYVWTPVGTLSTFGFLTPIPYPFGAERTGYLVRDMDAAIKAARAAGAEVIVEPFKDPIGLDAVIQWPGGVKMQLYWHFTAPEYAPLEHVPENRVYVSRDAVEAFVAGFLAFSNGRVTEDARNADGAEIGQPGARYRRIRIESVFGRMQVMVTDGHLPYPFGHETTGYEVASLAETLAKAKDAGAVLLAGPQDAADRHSAMLRFPGGYIAEVHDLKPR